jgi:hypothetical protein
MDAKKAQYVIRYYGQLMTTPERLAHRHLMGTAKATHGRTDAVAQREAENSSHPARELLSNDPGALQLASDGIDAFVARTAQRILDEHSNEVAFNYCPCCGALAKTPKARQCSVCRHDWHSAAWTTQRCCQLWLVALPVTWVPGPTWSAFRVYQEQASGVPLRAPTTRGSSLPRVFFTS